MSEQRQYNTEIKKKTLPEEASIMPARISILDFTHSHLKAQNAHNASLLFISMN
jgi:hypothetical protein